MYAMDNRGEKERSVCGAVSWQISDKHGNPITDGKERTNGPKEAKRLVITHHVGYR